jgi:hypothetical protein
MHSVGSILDLSMVIALLYDDEELVSSQEGYVQCCLRFFPITSHSTPFTEIR